MTKTTKQVLPQKANLVSQIEPLSITHPEPDKGSLLICCGSMCAGKSERLIELVGRKIIAGKKVLTLKPAIDNRKILHLEHDATSYIASRNGSWIPCLPVSSIADMQKAVQESDATIVAIDEIHFFTPEKDAFIKFVKDLLAFKKEVMLFGLDLDFRGEPFGPMPELLAYADQVVKLTAICHTCGTDTFCISQRLVDDKPAHYNDSIIVVDGSQTIVKYEPRCRKCHIIRKD